MAARAGVWCFCFRLRISHAQTQTRLSTLRVWARLWQHSKPLLWLISMHVVAIVAASAWNLCQKNVFVRRRNRWFYSSVQIFVWSFNCWRNAFGPRWPWKANCRIPNATFALCLPLRAMYLDLYLWIFESALEHEIAADNGQDAQLFLHKVQDCCGGWMAAAWLVYLNLFLIMATIIVIIFEWVAITLLH